MSTNTIWRCSRKSCGWVGLGNQKKTIATGGGWFNEVCPWCYCKIFFEVTPGQKFDRPEETIAGKLRHQLLCLVNRREALEAEPGLPMPQPNQRKHTRLLAAEKNLRYAIKELEFFLDEKSHPVNPTPEAA